MQKHTNKLEMYREISHLSWEAFAKKIGITRSQLFRIVHGQTYDVSWSTIEKIKKATGLDAGEYIQKVQPITKARLASKKK